MRRVLARLGSHVEPAWAILGASWAFLAPSWGGSWPGWAPPVPSLRVEQTTPDFAPGASLGEQLGALLPSRWEGKRGTVAPRTGDPRGGRARGSPIRWRARRAPTKS
eukprot:2182690-Pyramimonas_sp.AAC.1